MIKLCFYAYYRTDPTRGKRKQQTLTLSCVWLVIIMMRGKFGWDLNWFWRPRHSQYKPFSVSLAPARSFSSSFPILFHAVCLFFFLVPSLSLFTPQLLRPSDNKKNNNEEGGKKLYLLFRALERRQAKLSGRGCSLEEVKNVKLKMSWALIKT